ncbi:MAG: hypothetical protein E2O76_05425 [Caldithrix sp.]|nr:MAG: hypothetical protein E2O76_05425 [Caldithrix sp.]
MAKLFQSRVSEELNQKQQNLLQTLVREAPQKKIDALGKKLRSTKTTGEQQRYILECLKTINTPEARGSVEDFFQKRIDMTLGKSRQRIKKDLETGVKQRTKKRTKKEMEDFIKQGIHLDANGIYAQEILSFWGGKVGSKEPEASARTRDAVKTALTKNLFTELPSSFLNRIEEQAEYLLIPAGEFKYSVSEKNEQIQDIYFAKYPVTNQRYRRFISYLDNPSGNLTDILPQNLFAEKLLEFAQTIVEFEDYLGSDAGGWVKKVRSEEDANKRFNQDDQPVVSISWFAARAYCFWLSCLQATQDGDPKLQDVDKISEIYRLPTEPEWEWAAAGREPNGSLREYPWPKEKGKKPNEKLANYDNHVDATTPVGRYPDGATPEGLMDMAGNVWEWMENSWSDNKTARARALRGGSWGGDAEDLRCSGRVVSGPVGRYGVGGDGFRVVRPQSKI